MAYKPSVILCGNAGCGKDTIGNILLNNHGYFTVAQAEPLKRLCLSIFDFPQENVFGASHLREVAFPVEGLLKLDPQTGDLSHQTTMVVEHIGTFTDAGHTSLRASLRAKEALLKLAKVLSKGVVLTPRRALQHLGTEWGRKWLGVDVWNRMALSRIHDAQNQGKLGGVITDGRFLNEIRGTRGTGGKAVRIFSSFKEFVEFDSEAPKSGHASEAELGAIPLQEFDVIFINDKKKGIDHCVSSVAALNEWINGITGTNVIGA